MKTKLEIIVMVLIAGFVLSIIPQVVYAQQLDKKLEKDLTKKAKEQAKKMEKSGWEVSGSSKTLEEAFFEHYAKEITEKTSEQVGEVSACKSVNVCRKNALFNAQTDYAQQVSSDIQGFANEMQSNNSSLDIESDAFTSGFETKIKADLSGILKESFSMVREKDGNKEYRMYFIINKEREGAARKSAMEAALKETKLTMEQSAMVSKFIEDKFKEKEDEAVNSQMSELDSE